MESEVTRVRIVAIDAFGTAAARKIAGTRRGESLTTCASSQKLCAVFRSQARIHSQLWKDRLPGSQDGLIDSASRCEALFERPVTAGSAVRHGERRRLSGFGTPSLRHRRGRIDRLAADDGEQMRPGPRHHVEHGVPAAASGYPASLAQLIGQTR